mgnify:CR=1 FL=1|tara:strand:+ start:1808 stop:2944 length:1137 start_codon:yes stop_codon:yes gene_type:complete
MIKKRIATVAVMSFSVGVWYGLFGCVSLVHAQSQSEIVPGFEVPRFQVDPAWPNLPNGWKLGVTSSIAVDKDDHVWILHRPRLEHKPSGAPPVVEIDEMGNYVQGWGGPGEGYDWPFSEHGLAIDDEGNVWITGNNPYAGTGSDSSDDMLLKFSKTGEFLLQIGGRDVSKGNTDTDSLQTATDVSAHDGEIFVADGYGNKRVIVFDARTGAFRRMWGAFGNTPLDDPGPDDARRMEAGEMGDGPKQFSGTPHNIGISKDGLVYVCDRGNRRIQVFTKDGDFVRQGFVNRDAAGLTTAGVAFSSDPDQRFLYTPDFHWGHVWILDRRTLRVLDKFGEESTKPGDLSEAHDIATDSKGNIFVAEVAGGARAQKFVFQGIR